MGMICNQTTGNNSYSRHCEWGIACRQTVGNDVLSHSSLRGTKQSRKYYNALFITGLLRKLAMTDRHNVIGRVKQSSNSPPLEGQGWFFSGLLHDVRNDDNTGFVAALLK